jgi:mono/diheme cytochrome c family protein
MALHAGALASVCNAGTGPVARAQDIALYERACAPCHGERGDGDGPVAFSIAPGMAPRPRDFMGGTFKLRSTPSGALPTDADLRRTIVRGIPRYMPAFASLDDDAVNGLVARIKGFSSRFDAHAPAPVAIPTPPREDREGGAIDRGAALYVELGCPVCHGPRGRGDGRAAPALKDTTGLRIWPADLAHPSWFKGGSSPQDVYRTLMTGMDGTPMPGYRDVFDDLEQQAPWDLIFYLGTLSRE